MRSSPSPKETVKNPHPEDVPLVCPQRGPYRI
jgi:hypothetical protein